MRYSKLMTGYRVHYQSIQHNNKCTYCQHKMCTVIGKILYYIIYIYTRTRSIHLISQYSSYCICIYIEYIYIKAVLARERGNSVGPVVKCVCAAQEDNGCPGRFVMCALGVGGVERQSGLKCCEFQWSIRGI